MFRSLRSLRPSLLGVRFRNSGFVGPLPHDPIFIDQIKNRKHLDVTVSAPVDPPEAKQFKNPWRLSGAMVVMRTPVVGKPLEEWEEEWLLLRQRRDDAILQKPITYIKEEKEEIDEAEKLLREKNKIKKIPLIAHDDFVDTMPVPLITAHDIANNRKAINRKLWNTLYLIVKKDRKDHSWQFPQSGNEFGENMRETAERAVEQMCGKDVLYYTPANHPIAYMEYKFDPDMQKKADNYGSRVFFYPSFYLQGDVKLLRKDVTDYAWVTLEEMKEYVSKELHEKVSSFTFD